MTDVREKLSTATRPQLLAFIAGAIHGFTVMARDPEKSSVQQAKINNCIHYLAGRMIGLSDPNYTCSDPDLRDICDQVAFLNPLLRQRLLERLSS